MRIIRRKHWDANVWKREVLARLNASGCPVCAHRITETDREFFWFVNEQYYESETISEMNRSYGFCPVHTRHFLKTGANGVITTVFSYLTGAALSRLHEAETLLEHANSRHAALDQCRRVAETLRPRGTCRACRGLGWWDDHLTKTLVETLSDIDVKRAYRKSPGLCLPHFQQAGFDADWESLSYLAEGIRQRVMTIETSREFQIVLEHAAGMDFQRSIRRRDGIASSLDVAVLKPEPSAPALRPPPRARAVPWSPTFENLRALLTEPGCPVCVACERGTQEYFQWLSVELEGVSEVSAGWDPSRNVCPAHLWELFAAGHTCAATVISKRICQEWLWKIDDLTRHLANKPPERMLERASRALVLWGKNILNDQRRPSFRGMFGFSQVAAAVLESPERRLNQMRAVTFREEGCQACYYIQETTRRVLDLVLRALEHPAGRQAYHAGWGLCLRHCIAAAGVAEVPEALAEIIKAQIARLRLLEWELNETSRKVSWSVRYEPKGPEQSAWRRAAQMFCGVRDG